MVSGTPLQPPAWWEEPLADFESSSNDVVAELERAGEEQLGGTVKFFAGPRQMGDLVGWSFSGSC